MPQNLVDNFATAARLIRSESRRRPRQIALRLTDRELARLCEWACDDGISVPEYCRRALFGVEP